MNTILLELTTDNSQLMIQVDWKLKKQNYKGKRKFADEHV